MTILNYYKLSTNANSYQNLVPVNVKSWDIINNINLKSVATNWKPIELKFISKGRKKGDCPDLIIHLPVFSEKAINILNDLINDRVEYLPFICSGKEKYQGINVLKAVDCIDYDNSKVVRFRDGKIMAFEKYVFKKDKLKDSHIFKIPDINNSAVFVSQKFVNRVKEAGLEGFEFTEVG